uniref:Uncharacterized protein n=1 Tax=Plectus sambesii TaxID=2011161 RepID=A0A914WJR6_9BILA
MSSCVADATERGRCRANAMRYFPTALYLRSPVVSRTYHASRRYHHSQAPMIPHNTLLMNCGQLGPTIRRPRPPVRTARPPSIARSHTSRPDHRSVRAWESDGLDFFSSSSPFRLRCQRTQVAIMTRPRPPSPLPRSVARNGGKRTRMHKRTTSFNGAASPT